MKPVDKPGDNRNGKALGQGHKEEGGEVIVREKLFAFAILSLKSRR